MNVSTRKVSQSAAGIGAAESSTDGDGADRASGDYSGGGPGCGGEVRTAADGGRSSADVAGGGHYCGSVVDVGGARSRRRNGVDLGWRSECWSGLVG